MWVDTGCDLNLISKELCNKLSLVPERYGTKLCDWPQERIQRVSIHLRDGNRKLRLTRDFFVADDSRMQHSDFVLGRDDLVDLESTIDFSSRIVYLHIEGQKYQVQLPHGPRWQRVTGSREEAEGSAARPCSR